MSNGNILSKREAKRLEIQQAFQSGRISARDRDRQLGRMAYRNKESRAADRNKVRGFCKRHRKGAFTLAEVQAKAAPYLERWPELAEEIGTEFQIPLKAAEPSWAQIKQEVQAEFQTKPSGGTGTWKRNTGPANAARRGIRINNPGLDEGELRQLLNEASLVLQQKRISKRRLAAEASIDCRTLGRWLTGEDWPDAVGCDRLRAAIRKAAPLQVGDSLISRALKGDVSKAVISLREQPAAVIRAAMDVESAKPRPRQRLLVKLQKHLDGKEA